METQQPSFEAWSFIYQFFTEFGLPTFLCIYLLHTFQKKIDRLISLVDKLSGIVLTIAKTKGGDGTNDKLG